MRVSVERLEGVESATVSLNEGRAVIQLKPGNTVSLKHVRESVERNGFTPQAANVTMRARVIAAGDKLQLAVSGPNETYEVAPTPHAVQIGEDLKQYVGKTVVVEGSVPAPKNKGSAVIQVKSVKPADEKPE